MSNSLWPHGLQHDRLPFPSVTPWVCSSLLKLMSFESLMSIQTSHPLSPPSPLALNLSQHQGLFQWVGSLYQVTKELELQLHHQSSTEYSGLISLGLTGLICCPRKSEEPSPVPQFKNINYLAFMGIIYKLMQKHSNSYYIYNYHYVVALIS